MSDTGLYSGVYSQIRVFAELFDIVLLEIKSGRSTGLLPEFEELGRLLLSAGERSATNPRTQLLSALLREGAGSRETLTDLGKALLSGNVEDAQVHGLESLAQRLEHERAGMLGKMRGRGC